MPSPWWSRLLAGALAVHLVWGLVRLPGKVVDRRLRELATFAAEPTGALFAANGLAGADTLHWLTAHTDTNAAVVWSGDETGAIEFAAALLWPRLLIAERHVPAAATIVAGRVLATGTRDGRSGRLVLVGRGRALGLEVR